MPTETRLLPRAVVVLVSPTHSGNIGAVARAMKNMGLAELRLVAPHADPLAEEATARATQAGELLAAARSFDSLEAALSGCDRVVGTSARSRRERGWSTARALGPELAEHLAAGGRVALVFGQERAGLTNPELDRCSDVCRIPADSQHASLNLAQAVLLLTYELRLAVFERTNQGVESVPARRRAGQQPATATEMEALFAHYERSLAAAAFTEPHTAATRMRFLRKIFGRARLTTEEAEFLHGIAERIDYLLRIAGEEEG